MQSKPTDWHRRPTKVNGPCPICGCPGKKTGEHRRIDDPGAAFPRFVKRKKSARGWHETCIDTTPKRRRTTEAPDPEPDIKPTEWHRKPPGTTGACSICGCPGEKLGEHRRIDGLEATFPRFLTRKKTRGGWKETRIGPTEWHHRPPKTKGNCHICGCPASRPGEHRRIDEPDKPPRFVKRSKSDGSWQLDDVVQGSPCQKTRERILVAVRMKVYQGKTDAEIAAALGVREARIWEIRRVYSAIWNGLEQTIANEVATLIRNQAGTDAVLEAPDLFVARASICEKWSKASGESLFPIGDEPTLTSFYESFFVPVRLSEAADTTKQTYRDVLKRWRLVTGDPPLSEINVQMLAKFKEHLQRSRGKHPDTTMSASTVAKMMRHLQAILDKAGPPGPRNRDAADLIERAPWIRPPRPEPKPVRVVTLDTLNSVYAAAVGMKGPTVDGLKPSLWWQALLVVTFNTGLRRGTLFKLRWEWLDWEKRVFVIPGHSMKAKRLHVTPLNETAIEHLRMIYSENRELVFPWPMDQSTFDTYLHRLLDRAGIPRDQHFGLHDLRKTLATALWEASPQAAQLALGHTSSAVTVNHYVSQTGIVANAIDQLAQPSAFTTTISSGRPA